MSAKFNVSFGSDEEDMKLYALTFSGKSKYVKKCIKFYEDNIEFLAVWKQLCNRVDRSLNEEYIRKAIEFYIKYNKIEDSLEQILDKAKECE